MAISQDFKQSCFRVYVQKKQMYGFKQIIVHLCLQQHSHQPNGGSNPNVCRWTDKQIAMYTYNGTLSRVVEMVNFILCTFYHKKRTVSTGEKIKRKHASLTQITIPAESIQYWFLPVLWNKHLRELFYSSGVALYN